MSSRRSSSSEGEIFEESHKATSLSPHSDRAVDKSNRASGLDGLFGLDGGGDYYRSRSGRGYGRRRSRTRSPSPWHRKRDAYRFPSPRQDDRDQPRSPSPFHHDRPRKGASNGDNPHRHHENLHKRKASPPRLGRPDKRQHTDYRGREERQHQKLEDHTYKIRNEGILYNDKGVMSNSYGDIEHPPAMSGFHPTDDSKDSSLQIGNETKTGIPQNEPDDLQPIDEKKSLEETREEKRRKWAAIRAAAEKEKPKEDLLHQAIRTHTAASGFLEAPSPTVPAESLASPTASLSVHNSNPASASPDILMVDKQYGSSDDNSPAANSQSAADYDPTKDMLDDRNRNIQAGSKAELSSDAYNEIATLPAEKIEPVKKKKEVDMFASDDESDWDDAGNDAPEPKGTVLDEKLLHNWDDVDGYYKFMPNELVYDKRFRIVKGLGKGMYATVVEAQDVTKPDNHPHRVVAIKMTRRNAALSSDSKKEIDFVRKVNEADPNDKRHVIRLLVAFHHKGHFCSVFEHMSKNLRDLLKEDTNGHGLSMQAVITYARQMLDGLQHLQDLNIVHFDLKPDNILVSKDKKTVKLCDFGTAWDKRDLIAPLGTYVVSRFYRAPEIILGLPVGHGVDMWAIACTIYELWTGKILFTGATNNQMVKAFMDCLGWPTEKLLKKADWQLVDKHFLFDGQLRFREKSFDPLLKRDTVRIVNQQKKVPRDLKTRLKDASRGIIQDAPTAAELNDFADLLSGCLNYNPDKRLQPKDALAHKFLQSKLVSKPTATRSVVPRSAIVKPTMHRPGNLRH